MRQPQACHQKVSMLPLVPAAEESCLTSICRAEAMLVQGLLCLTKKVTPVYRMCLDISRCCTAMQAVWQHLHMRSLIWWTQ